MAKRKARKKRVKRKEVSIPKPYPKSITIERARNGYIVEWWNAKDEKVNYVSKTKVEAEKLLKKALGA